MVCSLQKKATEPELSAMDGEMNLCGNIGCMFSNPTEHSHVLCLLFTAGYLSIFTNHQQNVEVNNVDINNTKSDITLKGKNDDWYKRLKRKIVDEDKISNRK
jgi:hypothetical protein